MTSGNQMISRSGVFFPALLTRTGTSVEDFELYGSLHKGCFSQHKFHSRTHGRLLFVVDTDKGSTRSSETGHWALAEYQPLKHRKNCLDRRVQKIKRIARLAAQADGARCNMLCTVIIQVRENR